MSGFVQYLQAVLSGGRSRLVVLLLVLVGLVAALWYSQQQRQQHLADIGRLLELDRLSASIAVDALAVGRLELAAPARLSVTIEAYQQQLDTLRSAYQADRTNALHGFAQLEDSWASLRAAATAVTEAGDQLKALRGAVEIIDQLLPALLADYDRIVDAVRSATQKPTSLKLLREQRLLLHRLGANINAATASALSAVDRNAREALTGSIEADLFLLEKSMDLMAQQNKELLRGAENKGTDVSLPLEISAILERLTELADSVRKVVSSASLMRTVNGSSQILIEDSGLLAKQTEKLISARLRQSRGFSRGDVPLYVALMALLLWPLYMSYRYASEQAVESKAAADAHDVVLAAVNDIARQIGNVAEGDHNIDVSSDVIDCGRLVVACNRLTEHMRTLDQRLLEEFLPLIKRLSAATAQALHTIDRQANDIARLSGEWNHSVARQMDNSSRLLTHIRRSEQGLEQLTESVRQRAEPEITVEADVRLPQAPALSHLYQHVDDRLQALRELGRRINIDVVELALALASRATVDRPLRRSAEQLQTLTARYDDLLADVGKLIADLSGEMKKMMSAGAPTEAGAPPLPGEFLPALEEAAAHLQALAADIAGIDKEYAQQAEAMALTLDEMQDANQRLSVASLDSDVLLKKLDKLASANEPVKRRLTAEIKTSSHEVSS